MITHLLDTSALLAHYLGEPGADAVQALFGDAKAVLAVCVITRAEFEGRLRAMGIERGEAERVCEVYFDDLTRSLAVDREVVAEAISIRQGALARIPLVDALIAGCARRHQAILVHRDPHLASIPEMVLRQTPLADKA